LQTLISLPLLYPKHFSCGVLADHSLSGVLLFGPPGTGKTMLARAVASESGSAMLEIKGSDIYDKYVGESEKNVRAIFSLARKMSPCVIFIDEVDALFASRGADLGGSGKRETVNQFMAEWDGLRSNAQNRGVTVLCATNRPFDLDDAVLRRMPRRILGNIANTTAYPNLVDLPSEKDRQRILELHLRREQLDDTITTQELAKRTPLYSGSDLKNLCVTAALAAVREQDTVAPAGSATDEGTHSASSNTESASSADRTLSRRHFELALREIAPSCSDEMRTLGELRRWDRLYGDG
ncbi:P-loop containing nucleoside triphosphate hydrolase protein, partial [Thamnocephalis sphaerospora]